MTQEEHRALMADLDRRIKAAVDLRSAMAAYAEAFGFDFGARPPLMSAPILLGPSAAPAKAKRPYVRKLKPAPAGEPKSKSAEPKSGARTCESCGKGSPAATFAGPRSKRCLECGGSTGAAKEPSAAPAIVESSPTNGRAPEPLPDDWEYSKPVTCPKCHQPNARMRRDEDADPKTGNWTCMANGCLIAIRNVVLAVDRHWDGPGAAA